MVTEQKVGLGPYKMFDSLLLASLKMLGFDQKFENDNDNRISERILNYIKITSDRKKAFITFNSANSEDNSNFHEG